MPKKRAKRKRPSSYVPTADKILAGCYIDFEGFGATDDQPPPKPILIGLLNHDGNGSFKQVVFTNNYKACADDAGVDHEVAFCDDRTTFLNEMVKTSSIAKPIFAYTEYEKNVIETQVGHRITRRYRNVRTIAKRWFNREECPYPKPASQALHDMMQAMGLPLQHKLPKGGVTDRLRAVRDYSSSKKKWDAAPSSVRRQWKEILQHNKSDVTSIFTMMVRIRGIEEPLHESE